LDVILLGEPINSSAKVILLFVSNNDDLFYLALPVAILHCEWEQSEFGVFKRDNGINYFVPLFGYECAINSQDGSCRLRFVSLNLSRRHDIYINSKTNPICLTMGCPKLKPNLTNKDNGFLSYSVQSIQMG
jgi:hypothetical protein